MVRRLGPQGYPTRLVHVIARYGPGGPPDVFSRIVAQKLSEALKQSFVVENRPGASTMIASGWVGIVAPAATPKPIVDRPGRRGEDQLIRAGRAQPRISA